MLAVTYLTWYHKADTADVGLILKMSLEKTYGKVKLFAFVYY